MTSLRSRRLERLLNNPLEAVSYADIRALVDNRVRESFDLEFKKEHYGNGDSARRDLCGDVAAMANSAVGGLLILGIAEDEHAQAVDDPGVAIDDAALNRIRQVVAAGVSPLPDFDVLPVANPAGVGNGAVLIAVPGSPQRPHAVLVNQALRYPKRNGTTITYLTEPDVAQEYSERGRRAQTVRTRLVECERDLLATINPEIAWTSVVVTLVPAIPGDFLVDAASFQKFNRATVGTAPGVLRRQGLNWERTGVAAGRLTAFSGHEFKPVLATQLHQDGAGTYAVALAEDPPRPVQLLDEDVVESLLSGLRWLGRHSRDRAATGGSATVRVTLWPLDERPVELVQDRRIGTSERVPGTRVLHQSPLAEGVFELDDLADDGPGLVGAAHRVATAIFQGFGLPEVPQTTPEGELREQYWGRNYVPALRSWAAEAGIKLSSEKVPAG